MTDDYAEYARRFARMNGLGEAAPEDEARLARLAERAIRTGLAVPRIADKEYEPIVGFDVASFRRWSRSVDDAGEA